MEFGHLDTLREWGDGNFGGEHRGVRKNGKFARRSELSKCLRYQKGRFCNLKQDKFDLLT